MNTLPKNHPNRRKEEEPGNLQALVLKTGQNPLLLWRRERGLSRVELAALCGINVGAIEKLELGYFKSISQRLLLTLHDKAGIPFELAAAYLVWRNLVAERAKERVKGRG